MKKYLIIMITALTLLFGMQTMTVAADIYIPKEETIVKAPNLFSQNIHLDGVKKKSDVTKVKSTNKSVLKAEVFDNNGTIYVGLQPKKDGKATVTFNYKLKGKTHSAKIKVKVVKYVNALKSLKIGSKEYASQFNKAEDIFQDKKLSGKLNVKVKSGYSIVGINSYSSNGGVGFKTLKNGKKVTIKKGHVLSIGVRKNSTNVYYHYAIRVD